MKHWKQIHIIYTKPVVYNNPNTFAGLVGKVRKNYFPKEEGRKGGEKKCAWGSGLKPGTCRVVGEGPQLHARGAV